jgi:diguanylate cyclase (GGDEF)-like protein/PAS domain S-box-containing protein
MHGAYGPDSLQGLRQFSQSVYEGRRLTSLLSTLMTRASQLPNVDTVRILITDEAQEVLLALPGTFPGAADERPIPIGVGFAGRIASTRRPLLVSDLAQFPVYGQALREAGVRCAIGVPLLVGEKLLGVMHIGSFRPGAFRSELIPELQEVAERVALTVEAIAAEVALAESEQRFRTLFEDAPIGVSLLDLRPHALGHILLANEALSQLTGYSVEQLQTMNALDLLAPSHRPDADSAIGALADRRSDRYAIERQLIREDGSAVWVVDNVALASGDPAPDYAVSYIQDVSARKEAEGELARRAFTDPLTGLANRHLVMDHLALALRQEVRSGRPVGVLYLDVDHFKDINDVFGHDAGDRVLREIAARLTVGVRAADTPGRLGGDEFIVVCPHLSSDSELTLVADRLMSVLAAPLHLPNLATLDITASMGITTGDRSSSPDELVRRADVAMYEAKRKGRRRWHLYSQALDHSENERIQVESLLSGALREGWFELHYQPIVDLAQGTPVGVEALLRIRHPDSGLLSPDLFIAQLEQSDLADEIETWVLTQACRDWMTPDGKARTGLSVNVSGRLAASGHLADTVLAACDGFPLNRLTVEMTERAMVHAGPSVTADIQRLADTGVRIAIDDFGTGYASLTYLQRFPIGVVKIDRSFVLGLACNARDEAIVRAVISLGSSLDMLLVAEGVEAQAQADALRDAGCPYAQGYLFGRPQPRAALLDDVPPAQ